MYSRGRESAATRLWHEFLGFAPTELPVIFRIECCQMKYPDNYSFF